MSLLNEALRKNRSEKTQKVIFNAPSPGAINPKRALFFILPLLAASAGFAYMWTMDDNELSAPSVIRTESKVIDNGVISVPETVTTSFAIEKEVIKEPAIEVSEVKDKTPDIPAQVSPDKVEISDDPKKDIVQEKIAKEDKAREVITPELKENADAFLEKAIQLHRQARLENALTMYKKVLNLSPSNSEAPFNMASIYITMNRYQDAYNILSGLSSNDKQDPKAILNLAVSEIGLKKYTDALTHLNTLDADDPELLFEISFHKGVVLSRTGEFDEAIASYMAAEKISSNHPGLLLNMAVLYDKHGKYKEAIDYYTKLINSGSPELKEMDIYKNRIEALRAYLPVSSANGLSQN